MNLVFLLLSFIPPTDTLPYRHLAWSDFRGPIPADHQAALTATELSMITTEIDGRLHFEVKVVFLATDSYTTTTDPAILRHEQTHFDIAEIMRRRFAKALLPYRNCRADQEQKADALYDYYSHATNEMNAEFDKATRHSLDKVAETAWEAKVHRELVQLHY